MSKLIIKRPDLSQGGYLALPHAIIRDRGLSIDAIGILTVMASNADGWDYTVKSLAKSLRITENRTRNAVRELEAAGLLKRDQPIDPVTRKTLDGTWTIDLTIDRRSGINATAPTSTDDASPQVETVESIPAPRKSTRLIEDHDQKISSRREAPATATFSITDQMRSWAQENHPHVNVDHATAKYIAHYADKTPSRKSWEKWIAREKTPKPSAPARDPLLDVLASYMRQRDDALAAEDAKGAEHWGKRVTETSERIKANSSSSKPQRLPEYIRNS